MNNPKSMVGVWLGFDPRGIRYWYDAYQTLSLLQVLGWVSLISVAGVSFYFAKQSINERRRQHDITGERPSARLECE